jgi:hypothetical protein
MITEKEIVYSILNSLRGGHSNNNDLLSVRLIRSWIANERANLLLQFTDSGRSISEENYQSLNAQTFSKVYPDVDGKPIDNVYKKTLPKIIYFNRRSGVRIRHNNTAVLMSTKSQDRSYQKDRYFSSVKRAWVIGNEMYVRIGNGISDTLTLNIDAVLFYPGESVIYNWETDVYPLQSELMTVLKETAIKKEQNIVNQALNDTTNNFTSDNGTA